MTEVETTSAEPHASSDEAHHAARLSFLKNTSRFPVGVVLLVGILAAVAYLGCLFVQQHMLPGATVTPSSTAVIVQLEQRVTDIEQKLHVLGGRLDELEARVGKDLPVSVSTELPSPSNNAAVPVAPAVDPQITARMQSDMAALSASLSALQAEVKQNGSAAAQTQQTTQNALAAAIAFVQLRETAAAGRGFATDLTALRAVAGNDSGFQEPLARLEPYAAKGAPTLDGLRDEFANLEAPASIALDKATAQNWQDRLLADVKGLVSIRPLHGGTISDAFAASEAALASGEIAATLDAVKTLPPEAQAVFADWRAKAEARQEIDAALRALGDRFIARNQP